MCFKFFKKSNRDLKYKKIKPMFKRHIFNGHPSYIYAENKTDYKYIGITHSSKTGNKRNIQLRFNPNKNDPSICYARPFSTHDKKYRFRDNFVNYKINKVDNKIIRNIKKNYRQ